MTRVDVKPGVPTVLGRDVRCVQFTEPLPDWQHRRLGRWLARHPQATLRVYGNYTGGIADLDFLRHYPRIAGFAVDTIYGDTPDLSGLSYLPDNLQRLHLGVPSGEHGDRLLARATDIVDLSVARHKRLPEAMSRLKHVRTLYVEGPVKDIDVVSAMTAVEDLTLRSVTVPDLTPLLPLRSLTSLDIKLGGIRDLALLPQLGSLTYLELWQIRGLSDLSSLGHVTTLERLHLESLKNVTELPALSRLTRLTRIEIGNLSGLTDLRALATAPALEHLWMWDATHLQPEALRPLAGHPALRSARIGLGSVRKNTEVERILQLPEE